MAVPPMPMMWMWRRSSGGVVWARRGPGGGVRGCAARGGAPRRGGEQTIRPTRACRELAAEAARRRGTGDRRAGGAGPPRHRHRSRGRTDSIPAVAAARSVASRVSGRDHGMSAKSCSVWGPARPLDAGGPVAAVVGGPEEGGLGALDRLDQPGGLGVRSRSPGRPAVRGRPARRSGRRRDRPRPAREPPPPSPRPGCEGPAEVAGEPL